MKLSVVMPVFNEATYIVDQLTALAAQTFSGDWELIVADNGSIDGTQDIVVSWKSRLPIRLLDAAARRGVAAARNMGVAAADGDAFLFCDADDVASSAWLAAHEAALQECSISGGALLRFVGEPNTGAAIPGALPTLLGWLPYAAGGNCAVRREAYDDVGGFNERNLYAEDVEFSWLAQLAGHSLGYAPDAVMHVRTRGTSRALFTQHYRYGKSDVDLYQRYRKYGARRPAVGSLARTYGGLIVRLPAFRSRSNAASVCLPLIACVRPSVISTGECRPV